VKNRIRIERACVEAIEKHAREDLSVECCGLLTGRGGVISQVIAARNAAENPATGYEIAPKELIPLLRAIRESGLQLLGIYHSHPRSENFPSPKDIEMTAYPGSACFIFSPLAPPEKSLRAFSILEGAVTELAIETV
jgi:[CysO sulfur-carrier protein]-S-L-cysteine hydrolase